MRAVHVIMMLCFITNPVFAAITCEDISVNGTTITMPDTFNTISSCVMGSITFQTQTAMLAGLTLSENLVSPGSVMRVILGSSAFAFTLLSTIFQQDARLFVEGTLYDGVTLTVSGCSFDVRTPLNGATVAIDFRNIMSLMRGALLVTGTTMHVSSTIEGQDLIAAVAATPDEMSASSFLVNTCDMTLNTTSTLIAYGIYYEAAASTRSQVGLRKNAIRHVTGSDASAAFFVKAPLANTNNLSSLSSLSVSYNTVDRVGGFLSVSALVTTVAIFGNEHTHNAAISCDMTYATIGSRLVVDFSQNTFRTIYEAWDAKSSYANPVVSFILPQVPETSEVLVNHNNFYASRFVSTPLLFPGSTNLEFNSSVWMYGNYYTASTAGNASLPMSSFAISPSSPPRTVDLGTVFLCSNAWPAITNQATTTTSFTTTATTSAATTAETTTPTTRAPVAAGGLVSLFVDANSRPANVNVTGGGCPVVTEVTRRPNSDPQHKFSSLIQMGVLGLTSIVILTW